MARYRRRGRSRGGFGLGRVASVKNILFTVGGAMVAGQMGGAIGGFLGAGLPGALLGYFVGVPAANAASGLLGAGGTSNSNLNW